jgi:hypothetical protein
MLNIGAVGLMLAERQMGNWNRRESAIPNSGQEVELRPPGNLVDRANDQIFVQR